MLSTVLAGVLVAVSFSAPPGPVALETIRRGARGGFAPALSVQLGSVIGDLAWCAAALIGLAPLVQIGVLRITLGLVGVGLLIFLGAAGIRDALRPPAIASTRPGGARQGAFRSGMAISLANPQAIAYWVSVGGALVASGAVGQSLGQTASFISGFVGGTLMWCFFMALAVRFGRLILNPTTFRWITLTCGAAMIFFGISLASQMVGNLL